MAELRSHQLDIYGAWLHLATDSKSYKAMRRRLPSLEKQAPEAAGSVTLVLHIAPSGLTTPHLAIWIDPAQAETPVDLIETTAHEATHAATALLDHIGQGYDGGSEALAYLVGWITGWLWEACA